jgi:cobalamin-dependent methionine synthase I
VRKVDAAIDASTPVELDDALQKKYGISLTAFVNARSGAALMQALMQDLQEKKKAKEEAKEEMKKEVEEEAKKKAKEEMKKEVEEEAKKEAEAKLAPPTAAPMSDYLYLDGASALDMIDKALGTNDLDSASADDDNEVHSFGKWG